MLLPRETHQCSSSIALDFCLLNTRGSNKGDEIVEFVTDNDIDILAMTETWLKPDHVVARGDMTPAGYSLYEEPRPGEKRGGGVAILCKANLNVKKAKRFKAITFESINALITSGRKSVRLVVVYRPPSKKDQNATEFLAEFAALLETLALDNANLIIVGDFNIHMDDQTSRTGTANMVDLLAENDLTQSRATFSERGPDETFQSSSRAGVTNENQK